LKELISAEPDDQEDKEDLNDGRNFDHNQKAFLITDGFIIAQGIRDGKEGFICDKGSHLTPKRRRRREGWFLVNPGFTLSV
jgi:hypothetical protein